MNTEIERRKKAVQMYYYQHLSKSEICRRLPCTRPWLTRWLERYDPDDVEGSLSDRKRQPKKPYTPWSNNIRQQVIEMRKLRNQRDRWPYALVGASAIHYELKALNSPDVPPIRTIHRWLADAGLVQQRIRKLTEHESKPIPLPKADSVNASQQLDLKGPIYLSGSSHKYYLVMLRDRYSHRCAIDALKSRESQGITDFLVNSWHWLGLPTFLQMDNALEFRGSNRYPRSFGRVVRIAIDLGIEPVFNPPREPWRNGGIERHNGFLEGRLLAIDSPDFTTLKKNAKACQDACNQTHRSKTLNGLTPDEVVAQTKLHLLPIAYKQHKATSLPQNKGFVSFVRLVRKSGRITLGAKDRFMVDPELAYTYVMARVNLAQQFVNISQDDQVIKTYDYSPNTVGAWAQDEKDHGNEKCNTSDGICEH